MKGFGFHVLHEGAWHGDVFLSVKLSGLVYALVRLAKPRGKGPRMT